VALVDEVPHVDAVCLCDEHDAGSGRGEGAGGVGTVLGEGGFEDRGVVVFEGGSPDAKVKVVDSQQEVLKERRSGQFKHGSVISFRLVVLKNVLDLYILFLRLPWASLFGVSWRFH